MKSRSHILSALFLSALPVLAGSSSPSVEHPVAVAPEVSPWTCRLSIYGWAEGLDGDAAVKGITAPVDVGFKDILENLDMTAMAAVEVGYGRWSFIADGIYADLGDSQTGKLGGLTHLDLKQFVGNFLVAYEVAETDAFKFGLYAGTRLNSIKMDLSYGGSRGRSFNAAGDETWVDPVIGARFQATLPKNFFFRALGDVGGFDVSSQFTWQALAAFGYNINEHSSVLLGYRAIGTDYTNGGFTYDIISSGIIMGYQYAF